MPWAVLAWGILCRVPVSATYTVYHGSSEPVMMAAEYADIPAEAIAAYLVERCGVDAIFGGDSH